jgi:DNA polymerase I-like protein with 3'-5' exonuclease and polymerase domains
MIISVDFETYYDREFSLSKMTTEEYVRDDNFEVIGVGVKVDDAETEWFSGTYSETMHFLGKFKWSEAFVLAHNTMFDGAILTWKFGIKPMAWLDTLCMARAIDNEVSNSLAKLADRLGVGQKGNEVIMAMGKRRVNFTPEELAQYGKYCCNDVDLCYNIYNILKQNYKLKELKLIDLTLKMFTDPVLQLNLPLLEQHLGEVKHRKEALIEKAMSDRETLMSNQKFAMKLAALGVRPPTKISPTTGKVALALAKSDNGFKDLAEHPNEEVQALVAARLGAKSTLEETRTERFISIAKRGSLPVPLRYYAAHTGRWGGDDKVNLQNLPRKSKLKDAIIPPEGYVLIDADSSQIEARTVAWLAGQTDLVDAFENGEDVYRIMASRIYHRPIDKITTAERFVGKTTILGAGYGMGWKKFQAQLKTFGVEMTDPLCKHIVETYRGVYPRIPNLWLQAESCLDALASEDLKTANFGMQPQAVSLLPGVGFDLPSGLPLKYMNLRSTEEQNPMSGVWEKHYIYNTRKGTTKIYGGKVVENICQAVARCVIGEQMLRISKKYRVVLTVHDAIACVVKKEEVDEATKYITECMKWRPKWAETLPLSCEIGHGDSYGEC